MAAVGQLAAGVAHEINNPLTVILGFAQLTMRNIRSNDPNEKALSSIEREAMRCRNLVQDLLTFSRNGEIGKKEISLTKTIEGALSLLTAQEKSRNIELVKELENGRPMILANQNQIQQVIVNLASNAIDAMPEGGRITVRSKRCHSEGEEFYKIQVEDTGEGIPAEICSKIFDPFYTTKEQGKGTGLGLSLAYEIIQKHQGDITVDSEIGKGSTFTITLPSAAVASVAK